MMRSFWLYSKTKLKFALLTTCTLYDQLLIFHVLVLLLSADWRLHANMKNNIEFIEQTVPLTRQSETMFALRKFDEAIHSVQCFFGIEHIDTTAFDLGHGRVLDLFPFS